MLSYLELLFCVSIDSKNRDLYTEKIVWGKGLLEIVASHLMTSPAKFRPSLTSAQESMRQVYENETTELAVQ